ncbi:MAG: hypothetical protein ABH879_00740 [archaeon]
MNLVDGFKAYFIEIIGLAIFIMAAVRLIAGLITGADIVKYVLALAIGFILMTYQSLLFNLKRTLK